MPQVKLTEITGCLLLEGPTFTDNRGFLSKPYSSNDELGLGQLAIAEVFWSKSEMNVFRGLHLQLPPHAVSKTVFCISGSIQDVIIDLRIDSDTYLNVVSVELSQTRNFSNGIFIPRGCAHGFYVKSQSAVVLYLQSGRRVIESESGIHYAEISSKVGVSADSFIFSNRDENLPNLSEFPKLTIKEWESSD